MTLTKLTLPVVLFFPAIIFGCRTSESGKTSPSSLHQLASPALSKSQTPNLFAAADGKIYLSWVEALAEDRHALKFSVLKENGWSDAKMIAQGNNWFVNWADFPSLSVLKDGARLCEFALQS